MTKVKAKNSPEIDAIGVVYGALKGLDPSAQTRVLRYAADMLGLGMDAAAPARTAGDLHAEPAASAIPPVASASQTDAQLSEAEGINPVALKWMKRNGLDPNSLQRLFSLGVEEIDLVSKTVPGENKKERMRSVLLLKGIAAYLGTGAARVTYEQLKEACLHYNAYDGTNFASYLRSFAPEVAGTKEAGFTLTARGLTSGTELVRNIIAPTS